MKSALTFRVLVVGCALLSPALSADRKRAAKQPQRDAPPAELIWPLPPDPPRIRWIAEFSDLAKVKKQIGHKPGLMDRLSGAKAPDEKLELRKPYGITTDRRGRIFVAD